MQGVYETSILVKEKEINKIKYLQILLLIFFVGNYYANIKSKYEMSGFNGNKFYGNCLLMPGFLIEVYNLSQLFQMNIYEMTIRILPLSILIFIAVDFSIEVNIYKKYSKNCKKRIFIQEGQTEIELI